MAPKKKTSTMKWVVKSQQPAKMAEPATEKQTSSTMLDCSLLPDCVSKLQLSSSSSSAAKMAQPATKEHNDWSLLPEELLHIISEKLEDCFDVIHARSVCRPWRSTFPFPSCLLRTSYSLPAFEKLPRKSRSKSKSKSKSKDVCILEKFPMFLFRVRAPALPCEYFLGGIDREDHMEIRSPLQCSVKVKIPESDPTLIKILDCQILPLGYQYVMKGYDPNSLATRYRAVAFLPLNKEGGGGGRKGEFVVLISYGNDLFVLKSAEMRWMRLEKASIADCGDIVTFRGKFYAVFINGDIFVIDPYSLEWTPLMITEPLCPQIDVGSQNDLVPCDNDELFLVETIIPRNGAVLDFGNLARRVSRLDEEAGEWVVVTDLGDRVLFMGQPGNTSCSGKDLPDGCGVTGNSMLFTSEIFGGLYYKYGVETGNPEDDLSFWRPSRRDINVTILCTSPGPVVALRVDRVNP